MADDGEKLKKKCAARRNRNPVGRPKGGNLVNKAFNDAMERGDLASAMDTLVVVMKDTDHKHWAAAQKMVLDRVAHVTNYEKKSGSNMPTININIGDTSPPVTIDGTVVNEPQS